MTEATTLARWAKGLGIDLEVTPAAQIKTVKDATPAPSFSLQAGPGTWVVTCTNVMTRAAVHQSWTSPGDDTPALERIRQAAHDWTRGFPLVEAHATDIKGGVVVTFSAIVYNDGLTRQAFALTLSAVARSVEQFELNSAARVREISLLSKLRADAELALQERQNIREQTLNDALRQASDEAMTENGPAIK
ncbi:hypothetical protein [Amycolatopsis sp. FDAARGOS 1241]|uniref:hypothetical protein n=1 Tax=Amycolatopsis sp. FDAARGOS 1241 TaxID=2778070 RepID=UPI001951E4FB|nr:hypothetical protein [Amycolatopsis sp. FDAARGOS 1241]QRP49598.1 hypothetical protein I6J71_18695 [Amycolatopsis sp. FDAARGOS 1241]